MSLEAILKLQQENNSDEAKIALEELLKNDPENLAYLRVLSLFEAQDDNFDKAIDLIKKAITICPFVVEFYTDLAKIYLDKGDYNQTILTCQNILKEHPQNYEAWLYFAVALKKIGRIDDSIEAYEKAININPAGYVVYHNLGSIYDNEKNNPQKAIEYYEKFLKYEPNNEYAKGCLSTLYLKIKDFKKGWSWFEYSKSKRKNILEKPNIINEKVFLKPLWNGEDISDKVIYVCSSGGFGDTFFFSRFLPLLKQKCKKVLFRPHKSTVELFKENSLRVVILDENDPDDESKFDCYVAMMNLPCYLGINSENDIPLKEGYLKANLEKSGLFKQKYFDNSYFKIGINWEGDTTNESTRKIPLNEFYPLFDLQSAKFYSLQVGQGIEQLDDAKQFDITNLGAIFNDFSDTAAAIENLDLVITNDTAVANLAGAMGKECWIVLPFVQDWRWTTDISRCIWYDSVKLFRQEYKDNWHGPFNQILNLLENKIIS